MFARHISSMSEEAPWHLVLTSPVTQDGRGSLTSRELDRRSFQVSPSESMMLVGLIGDDVSERLRGLGEEAEG